MQKTINAARGIRKRINAGLPPYTATADERAKFSKTFAEIQKNLDERGKEDGFTAVSRRLGLPQPRRRRGQH